ncbi:oxidoreductase [Nocardioides deserti]|uniref:FAD-dependent oxidoreductase n=1 Tax=Nocardioides deserti TaxID=1588644 RepID=A0ABR6UBA9_9ACTN|nr:FAD-dependent oxidoreductase [Nocardioides deserti]MBC2961729.1 FAD-dependent oxidoreductase [Nocardioides deserti]GGO73085.1 NADH oxidase [Nocardioides deserti]
MSHPYAHLFEPIKIGPKGAKNRLWMTAHSTQLVKDHNFTDRHVAYYAERAKGGVGVITMEAMATHPTTQPYAGKIHAFDPAVIPNYEKLAAAVHEHGALLLAQPWHRGRETNGVVNRLPVWAPSSIPDTVYREMPHAMDEENIAEIVEGYTLAARYAAEGGLDGVEVHGLAHGYLLGQFLSPATNHRTDQYGGSEENRLRLVLEIIERTRAEVGSGLIVGVRINGDDGEVEGGLRTEHWARIARAIADTGLIDYVSVSQGTYQNRMLIYPTTPREQGYQIDATRQIKQMVPELPVVVAGRMTSPEKAEYAIASGAGDMVGMARTLIADPEWPNKAREQRETDIRPCVGANHCMASIVSAPLACIHNPAVGREAELGTGTLRIAERPRSVAVVGGGPGGMRAALTLAQRGHEVTLFEKGAELGGQVNWIARSESYSEWGSIAGWLVSQLGGTNVKVELGVEATVESLVAGGFDSIVVATGSTPLRTGWSVNHPARWANPDGVPGVDQFNVVTAQEALLNHAELGPNVMVFDDIGGRHAVVVAEHLQANRHQVELVTTLSSVAPELSATRDVGWVHQRLRTAGVVFTPNREIAAIDEDRVSLRDVHTDEVEVREPVDSVVLVTGGKAEDSLYYGLKQAGVEVRAVGDCVSPRRVFNAIWEAELAAREI